MEMIRNNRIGIMGGQSFSSNDLQWTIIRFGHQGVKYAKLQSICAVLTFDPHIKKILTFSIKDRYQLNYFICIKDFNAETITSLKFNLFSFLLYIIRLF
jgi:hypothetical protein